MSTSAKPEYEAFYQDMTALLKKHLGAIDSIEMLAVASNQLGKMIDLQDQRKYTSAQIMRIVSDNIEAGNAQMVAELSDKTAGHA